MSAVRNQIEKPKYMQIKSLLKFVSFAFIFLTFSCIEEFVPVVQEEKELLVVQGLITDQAASDTILLSKSMPFGQQNEAKPMSGCYVTITDNFGGQINLNEKKAGTYVTPPYFHGEVGRSYTLHIKTNAANGNQSYESYPVEMKPVPLIDSIYYQKIVIQEKYKNFGGIDECQIYLDTHDPSNICRYYRWDYSETWVLRLLFPVDNMTCWVSDKSRDLNIKSTEALDESKITGQPVTYITNATDRLKREYSILVNQYSLSEDEYLYLEKIKNLMVDVGGLYDKIPASIPNNLFCKENPNEKVLGYFSVSAKSSKRIFIRDDFAGIINKYNNCPDDTIWGDYDPPELNVYAWVLIDHPPSFGSPRMRVLTFTRACADCTTRGSNIKPDYWPNDK
jgi:hypothetical protein